MLSQVFLGMALVGAEWVMYLLLGLSILSVALIIERIVFPGRLGMAEKEQSFHASVG